MNFYYKVTLQVYDGLTSYVYVIVEYSHVLFIFKDKINDMEFHSRLRSTEAMFKIGLIGWST